MALSIKNNSAHQEGFSLVELMIALTLGLILIAGITALFVSNNRTRSELEKTSQQIENGRYATQLLINDLQLAGYYGELNPTTSVVATPTTLPDACATDSTSLTAAIALPIQGYDNGVSIPSSCTSGTSPYLSDLKSGSDILVVRRASTCFAGVSSCDAVDTSKYTYFQTTLCSTETTTVYGININTLHKKDCTNLANRRAFYTRIYFVTNNNQAGDGIPTLKVAELGSGSFTTSALAAGIEQLQLEYGLDTNNDGTPDVYTADPNLYPGTSSSDTNKCTSTACQTNWRNVTTVKVHLLARNSQVTAGYLDTRTYTLGKTADMATDNTFGAFNDTYKRHVYTTVVRMNNVAGRRE